MVHLLDSRPIPGNGGEVILGHWDGDNGLADPCYLVQVYAPAGDCVASIELGTLPEAQDAFVHPFARPEVPNIFEEVA